MTMASINFYRIIICIQITLAIIEWGYLTYLMQLDGEASNSIPGYFCHNVTKRPVVYMADDALIDHDKPSFIRYTMDLLGLVRQHETIPDWDIFWSSIYPFRSRCHEQINKPADVFPDFFDYQKVNHIPGSGFFGNKEIFTTLGGKYIPKTFRIPEQKEEFLAEVHATLGKRRLWIQKNIWHRGNVVKEAHECDLTTRSLIQEYIANPFLIDGRKFSMSIFVVWTSFNPMRMYIMEKDTPFRFCSKDYYPEDFSDIEKYVSDGLDVVNMNFYFQLPSLKMIDRVKYSNYQGLVAHLDSMGKDSSNLMKQILDAVYDKTVQNIQYIKNMFPEKYSKLRHTFFELLRWDLIMDENLKVHLIEANFSPNFPDESLNVDWTRGLFFNTIYNAFRLAGLADVRRNAHKRPQYIVRDSDILTYQDYCYMLKCSSCPSELQSMSACFMCLHCWSDDQKEMMKAAFLEHINRGSMRRVYPTPPHKNLSSGRITLESDQLTAAWFAEKCKTDIYWCS